MLQLLEQQQKLTTNQWKIFAAATIGDMLDFFDFFLIGIILAFIVKPWNLTFGESGAILLASGIAAPFGSMLWGWVSDKVGRRKAMILTILNFSIPTGLMALAPEGNWMFLAICRLFVGLGVTGLYAVDIVVVQEFVPASKRGWVTGLTTSLLPLGLMLGGLVGKYLAHDIGWRGVALIGLIPAALSLLGSRLGARVAALADASRAARGGAQVARLGVDGRSVDDRVAESGSRGAAHAGGSSCSNTRAA